MARTNIFGLLFIKIFSITRNNIFEHVENMKSTFNYKCIKVAVILLV